MLQNPPIDVLFSQMAPVRCPEHCACSQGCREPRLSGESKGKTPKGHGTVPALETRGTLNWEHYNSTDTVPPSVPECRDSFSKTPMPRSASTGDPMATTNSKVPSRERRDSLRIPCTIPWALLCLTAQLSPARGSSPGRMIQCKRHRGCFPNPSGQKEGGNVEWTFTGPPQPPREVHQLLWAEKMYPRDTRADFGSERQQHTCLCVIPIDPGIMESLRLENTSNTIKSKLCPIHTLSPAWSRVPRPVLPQTPPGTGTPWAAPSSA